jgi:DNA-directed RNA polymerase specialized sigma24 family protein
MYRRPVFRLAYAALLDPDMAGRAMHAGLASVLDALRPGISEEDFQRPLFQHTLKAAQKERARADRQRLLRRAEPPGLAEPAPDDYPDALTRRKMGLWHAIRALPEAQRVALTLRYEFALPLEVVAGILRSSEGVVHARLSAARQVLGAVFEGLQAAPTQPAPGASHE